MPAAKYTMILLLHDFINLNDGLAIATAVAGEKVQAVYEGRPSIRILITEGRLAPRSARIVWKSALSVTTMKSWENA
jgi:hypothetical protein